jgi:ATP-dependent DNA helicase PIF1
LDIPHGHVNGTRYIIEDFQPHCIKARKMTSNNSLDDDILFIPKIPNTTSDCQFPALLKRIQFPILGAYYITINRAQGQTLKYAGLFLQNSVFTHGQLYVALSRCGDPNNIFVFINQSEFEHLRHVFNLNKILTKNIVYKEIFN